MLDFFKRMFAPERSSETAKERLRLVLLSDHLSLAPDVVDALRADILTVISKYVDIDPDHADLTFEHREHEVAMLASIPILGVRERSAGVAASRPSNGANGAGAGASAAAAGASPARQARGGQPAGPGTPPPPASEAPALEPEFFAAVEHEPASGIAPESSSVASSSSPIDRASSSPIENEPSPVVAASHDESALRVRGSEPMFESENDELASDGPGPVPVERIPAARVASDEAPEIATQPPDEAPSVATPASDERDGAGRPRAEGDALAVAAAHASEPEPLGEAAIDPEDGALAALDDDDGADEPEFLLGSQPDIGIAAAGAKKTPARSANAATPRRRRRRRKS